jgi:hypothetical protein
MRAHPQYAQRRGCRRFGLGDGLEWPRAVEPFGHAAPEHAAFIAEPAGDFRPGHAPAAVVTVQFALIDLTRARSKMVLERTIGRRVAIQQATPDALVRGYGEALAEILVQLVPNLGDERVK